MTSLANFSYFYTRDVGISVEYVLFHPGHFGELKGACHACADPTVMLGSMNVLGLTNALLTCTSCALSEPRFFSIENGWKHVTCDVIKQNESKRPDIVFEIQAIKRKISCFCIVLQNL